MQLGAVVTMTAVDDPPAHDEREVTERRFSKAVQEAGQIGIACLPPRLRG